MAYTACWINEGKEEFEIITKEISRLILKKTKLWLRCIWCIGQLA